MAVVVVVLAVVLTVWRHNGSTYLTGVDTTKVRAAYNNGVLAITLPKYVKPQPTAQTISID